MAGGRACASLEPNDAQVNDAEVAAPQGSGIIAALDFIGVPRVFLHVDSQVFTRRTTVVGAIADLVTHFGAFRVSVTARWVDLGIKQSAEQAE